MILWTWKLDQIATALIFREEEIVVDNHFIKTFKCNAHWEIYYDKQYITCIVPMQSYWNVSCIRKGKYSFVCPYIELDSHGSFWAFEKHRTDCKKWRNFEVYFKNFIKWSLLHIDCSVFTNMSGDKLPFFIIDSFELILIKLQQPNELK